MGGRRQTQSIRLVFELLHLRHQRAEFDPQGLQLALERLHCDLVRLTPAAARHAAPVLDRPAVLLIHELIVR